MLIFVAVFLVLIVGLPGCYAFLVHMRDMREKAEEKAKATGEGRKAE